MSFNLNEMVQTLSYVTGTMAIFKEMGQSSVDYSAITPSIIAIGDIPDSKVEDLVKITNHDPVVIWNLGGKAISSLITSNFRNQVIDVQWQTPSPYTRAPNLQTVWSLCYSIKSWCDLNDRNLTLIHCPPGQPSTGILIACLLKYIGAFDHAAHAYDFYCSKRLRGDIAHTLGASYSNLFKNVDKVIDRDGFINDGPLFLKSITIVGLALEDTPCLEVWDASGLTYTSHAGLNVDRSCSWNSESGDGFFRVSQYVIGDFSVVCRFGGQAAATKDKSTLIFKYQNSTVFLVDEVVELRHSDVDVNPQYSDSIDGDTLVINLMFESNPALIGNVEKSHKESMLPRFSRQGIEAFEAGLDEISKFHRVAPDSLKYVELEHKGFDERFLSVALQLANNRVGDAQKLVGEMCRRAKELSEPSEQLQISVSPLSAVASDASSDDSNWEVVNVKCPVCKSDPPELEDQVISCAKCSSHYHTGCVGARRIPFGKKTEKDRQSYESYVRRHYGSWECPRCKRRQQEGGDVEGSAAEGSRSAEKDTAHSFSSPNSRISYAASTGGGGVIVTDKVRALTNATGQPMPKMAFTTPSKALTLHPPSPNIRSKHDQIAQLVGLLSSSGVGLEDLVKMNPEKQKETLTEVIQKKYPGYSVEGSAELKGHLDLAQAMKGIIANASAKPDITSSLPPAPLSTPTAKGPAAPADRYFGGQLAEEQQKQRGAEKEKESVTFDPRAHMLSVIMRRGEAAAAEKAPLPRLEGLSLPPSGRMATPSKTSLSSMYSAGVGFSAVGGFSAGQGGNRIDGGGGGAPAGPAVSLSLSAGVASTKVKDIPEYAKYFKMLKAGIDRDLVAEKAVADGVLGSKEVAKRLLDVNAEEPVPVDLYERLNALVSIANHPTYEKFFKMLKVGISKEQIRAKMAEEGLDASMIDKDPIEKLSLAASLRSDTATAAAETAKADDGKVALEDHPHVGKFFKMVKVGLPKETVRVKMQQEGFDAAMLDRDPSERVAPPTGKEVLKVPLGEHQVYGKFFKMLKVGLPKDAVKSKMREEGLDADLLDKDPGDLVDKDDGQSEQSDQVSLSLHPKYGKYFKMLQVGLPKDAVKDKMRQDGLDPAILDKDPSELVSRGEAPEGGRKKVPLSEHPLYAKYFKMLKVGLSKEAIKLKMQQGGANPDIIEKDPSETFALEEEKKEADDKDASVPVSEHPKYSKYFKMLKVGLPKDAVKAKMQQEGVNPDMLDKEPSELVPLDENKKKKKDVPMVAAAEHPKYSKYFKMLKVGLPKDAVKAKMQQEGVDPAVLDKEPTDMIPLNEEKQEEDDDNEERVPVSEHPKYSKYFKMLKVGLPKDAVKAKMQQEGVNPDMLDKEPSELVPLDENKKKKKDVPMVAAAEHPKYSKYFKMLKVGLPKDAVKAKMQQEGVDPAVLDKEPTDMIPLDENAAADDGPQVAASEHPSYAKFFKMLKVGLPLDAVKAKVKQEGLNPDILDKDPAALIPLDEKKADGGPKGGLAALAKPKPKRKKLHWKAFDASKVNENSLWAEEQEIDLELDEEEFKKLFVESAAEEPKKKATVAKPAKEAKKQVVLIDMKRAQNGGIALARIKFSFDELKEKILNMADEGLTTDQLKSMQEYLPNVDEVGSLRNFKGERDSIGIAERYMMVMMDFPAATRHITIMIYKQQFKARYIECRAKITRLQDACDDVRLSSRLKRVLKTILKVGNQLNDGEQNKGFTVDSLLKLHSAKALDKKTTILQYVVMLIFRNDEDSLKFPEDLKHVGDASRITMETIIAEKTGLQNEFEQNFKILEDIREKNPESNTNAMLDFFVKADSHCKELEKGYEKAKEKFAGVLTYFGEDASMPPHEFFTTLSKFIQDFMGVRETIDRARKAEQKKREQQQALEASNLVAQHKTLDKETTPLQRKAMRRHTMVPSKSMGSNQFSPSATTEGDKLAFPERPAQKESVVGDKELPVSPVGAVERKPSAMEHHVAVQKPPFDRDADRSEDKDRITPIAAASPRSKPLASQSSDLDATAVVPSVTPIPPPTLNFSDPNDRAAMLKEALAKKALSRRKSSIM